MVKKIFLIGFIAVLAINVFCQRPKKFTNPVMIMNTKQDTDPDSVMVLNGDTVKWQTVQNIIDVLFDSLSIAKINSKVDSIIINARIVTPQYLVQLYVSGDSTLSIGTADTYFTFRKFVKDTALNTTTTDSTITITDPGWYVIHNAGSYTHSINNTVVHHSIFINDVEYDRIEAERKIGTGGDTGNSGNSGLTWLNSGDVVKVRFRSDNTGTITVSNFNFHLYRL